MRVNEKKRHGETKEKGMNENFSNKKRQINEKNTADLKKYKKPRKMGKMETKGFFFIS
jgi:hypothetical protein